MWKAKKKEDDVPPLLYYRGLARPEVWVVMLFYAPFFIIVCECPWPGATRLHAGQF